MLSLLHIEIELTRIVVIKDTLHQQYLRWFQHVYLGSAVET